MPTKRRTLAHVSWAAVNAAVGFGVFVFVWAASGAADSGHWRPVVVSLLLGTIAILLTSGLTGYFARGLPALHAVLCDVTFLFAVALCLAAGLEGPVGPLVFWAAVSIWVFGFSFLAAWVGTAIAARINEPEMA